MSPRARLAWCCVSAAVVFLVWIGIGSGGNVGVAFFYAIPIGMATWWFGRRAGLTAAVISKAR